MGLLGSASAVFIAAGGHVVVKAYETSAPHKVSGIPFVGEMLTALTVELLAISLTIFAASLAWLVSGIPFARLAQLWTYKTAALIIYVCVLAGTADLIIKIPTGAATAVPTIARYLLLATFCSEMLIVPLWVVRAMEQESRMTTGSPYTLDAIQLEQAVQALQKVKTLRPTARDERLYRVLGRCLWVGVAALAGVILAVTTDASPMLTGALAIVFLLAAGSAPMFLLLNRSVVGEAFRLRMRLKKLGIRVSTSAWRQERKGYRWSRLAGAALTCAGVLSLLLGLLTWIGFGLNGTQEHLGTFVIVAPLFALGGTVLVWRFVQRSHEQLAIVADADRLRSALQSLQIEGGTGEVEVPAAVLEDVVRIEHVQIAPERRDTIVVSAGAAKPWYDVLVAPDLLTQKDLLVPKQRVAVEDLVEGLSVIRRPTLTLIGVQF